MTSAYWKMVAENIAKGLGAKAIGRLGTGGRFLARTGAVVGVGVMAFELFKNYKDNIENEPAYQEMVILQPELEKWGSAISCIGRDPYEDKDYTSFDEGGAINALFRKKLSQDETLKPADPEQAMELIERAIGYIRETENVLENEEFETMRSDLASRLEKVKDAIKRSTDYKPLQKELGNIVTEIKPIESAYSTRIYDCSREIQKSQGSNAAWAALSMVTLGLVKKPKD